MDHGQIALDKHSKDHLSNGSNPRLRDRLTFLAKMCIYTVHRPASLFFNEFMISL